MLKVTSVAAPILALGLAGLCSGLLACTPVPYLESPPWRADHHMHLGSVDLCERLGDCLQSNQPTAIYAADLISALDQAQVERGLVISSGYLYGLQHLGLDADAIASWTRKENEFTAAQVNLFPERLRGFLSVDPLQPSAIDEVRYWQNRSDLIGLKLHLFASAVDLNNPAHVASLRNVVSQAAAQSLPLLIHIGGGEFSAESAGILIQEILPASAPSFVQIAHAGGGLPLLGDNYVGVLRRFADHIDRDDPLTRRILFDLSYVPAPEQGAEIQAALLHEIRRIGMDRFLFGSDFNVLTIPEQIGMLQRMGLSDAELQTLRHNCAPWVCESTNNPN